MATMESDLEDVISDPDLEKLHPLISYLISRYVRTNPGSTNTKLFSMLALLNAYVPDSYLIMEECQKILGPPDPIHGGPPFKVRMEPFSAYISVSGPRVCLINPDIAMRSVKLLAYLNVYRSQIAKDCIFMLCGEGVKQSTVRFIKDLLTERIIGQKGLEKFSLLIKDIIEKEKFARTLGVLKKASNKFKDKHIFPQTVARLYYIGGKYPNYKKAEGWAKEAIKRSPNNSYAADTLGQVYKNRLLRKAKKTNEVTEMAEEAFKAFKDVEEKAEKELDRGWIEYYGSVNFSDWFNNRGHFGLIQVAKILAEKCKHLDAFRNTKQFEVELKFEFFEWYLSYSMIDRLTAEPDYFWKDVALCYEAYTAKHASDSTSFPALLDCLNHGLFVSKEKRAFKDAVNEKTESDLKRIRDELKTIYERNKDDVKVAERYILSNIILSNKVPHSPSLPQVRELQSILEGFLRGGMHGRGPEFYLLVLLLFWPEENIATGKENSNDKLEEAEKDTHQLQDHTSKEVDINEEDTREESVKPSLGLKFDPDLEQYISSIEKAYDGVYGKYLRGRYLLPLFFLGKGSGLSRWIHKSKLDEIVEGHVETQLDNVRSDSNRNKTKRRMINDIWSSGKVWELKETQNILLPIQNETSTMQQSQEKEFLVRYLGFNIRGPVIFPEEAQLNTFKFN
ncbi:sterile alpha motif domain-containing protein 9-like [Cyprinodon tularosa]|uniref:sterile alpha motif domain-containing protein 9-like n=1 Tax=Cyprinodon tularosa TaxID=77115 RepID=UPI0018E21FE3|nr:sterile alpha motif domain-containing protein 9-like [Cyprinodon tularosa]